MKKTKAFTLIEVLISIAILGIIGAIVFNSYRSQFSKGYDVTRKNDIKKIQIALEEYEKDAGGYPVSLPTCGQALVYQGRTYLDKVPCDPENVIVSYMYQTDGSLSPKWYQLYANLKNTSDSFIKERNCQGSCGLLGYNYYALSPNAPMPIPLGSGFPTFTPTATPTSTPTATATPTPTPTPTPPPQPPTPTPTATPTFTPTPSPVAVQFVIGSAVNTGKNSSGTNITSSSITAASNSLYLAFIGTHPSSTSPVTVTSLTGFCPTAWTLVKQVSNSYGGTNNNLEVWRCYGSPTINASVTAQFSASTTSSIISVLRYIGANPTTQIGNTTSIIVTSSTSGYAIQANTTPGSLFVGSVFTGKATHTPAAGYTETSDINALTGSGSTSSGVATGYKLAIPSTTSTQGSGTLSNSIIWIAIGVEIKD